MEPLPQEAAALISIVTLLFLLLVAYVVDYFVHGSSRSLPRAAASHSKLEAKRRQANASVVNSKFPKGTKAGAKRRGVPAKGLRKNKKNSKEPDSLHLPAHATGTVAKRRKIVRKNATRAALRERLGKSIAALAVANSSSTSSGRALSPALVDENPLASHSQKVKDLLSSLNHVGGKLPTVVDPTRIWWTVALAFAAAEVPGDFVETGVFQGGASIAVMGVLDSLRLDKRHWACDSFQGVPPPSEQDKISGMVGVACQPGVAESAQGKHPTSQCTRAHNLRVRGGGKWMSTRTNFERNVARFKVTKSRLRIVEGWFKDTLPPVGLKKISFLRLDGDMYNSTRDAIERLEPLVSPGGFVYVDDYGSFRGCALAIDEYRAAHSITAPMHPIAAGPHNKFQGLWWRKPR